MLKFKKRKGFTLLEAILSVAIMSIVSVGIFQLLRDGTYMFNFATARLSLTGESRITMLAIKKLIQQSQGST